MLKQVGV